MYNKIILERLQTMKNSGRVKHANGVGRAQDDVNGDILHFFMRVDETGVVEEASYKAFGSVFVMAVGSILADVAKNKRLKELMEIKPEDIAKELGKFEAERNYVLDLAIEALVEAVKDYYVKQEKKSGK